MIRLVLVFLTALLLLTSLISAEDLIVVEEESLPIGLTEEEMTRLHEIGIAHEATAPPTGNYIRNPGEWERSTGVIIRWPLGIPYALIAEMSEDLMVTTIVSSTTVENQARSAYQANGVNMANVNFLIAPTNSYWTRDYGPWFIFSDDRIGIVDHVYNRPRPLDDVIPQAVGTAWGIPVYGMNLVHTGGNHMSNGLGLSMSSQLVWDENPSLSHNQIDSFMQAYLGNDYQVMGYVETSGIHHIDCWEKFLSPVKILVEDVPASDPAHALLDAQAAFLATQMSPWGRPYEIVRIYCPPGTAYTNSIILNDKVLVPIFNSAWDDDALAVYQAAMPGYEILGFTGSWLDDDAIHCRAMGVPDRQMIFIRHVPLHGVKGALVAGFEVGAYIDDYSRTGLIPESLLIRYRVDGGSWADAPLNAVTIDSFTGFIPPQAGGSEVEYYLVAADNSGRVETHPFIGAPGAHVFTVNSAPVIVSADSFLVKAGGLFAYSPEIADPDDMEHTIGYSDYPVWLSVSNDTIAGTTPMAQTQATFTVMVADEFSSAEAQVIVQTYICGDVDNSGVGPNVGDLTYLVNFLFKGGPEPPLGLAANVDGSPNGLVNVADLTWLVNFLFKGGVAPVCN